MMNMEYGDAEGFYWTRLLCLDLLIRLSLFVLYVAKYTVKLGESVFDEIRFDDC